MVFVLFFFLRLILCESHVYSNNSVTQWTICLLMFTDKIDQIWSVIVRKKIFYRIENTQCFCEKSSEDKIVIRQKTEKIILIKNILPISVTWHSANIHQLNPCSFFNKFWFMTAQIIISVFYYKLYYMNCNLCFFFLFAKMSMKNSSPSILSHYYSYSDECYLQ